MINSYEIKRINNEDVLYLYFDFDYEFANLNFKEKKEDLEKTIRKFIKDNKIAFKGTTVLLMASGVLIGNMVLNNQKKGNSYITNEPVIEEKISTEIVKKTNEVIVESEENIVDVEKQDHNEIIKENKAISGKQTTTSIDISNSENIMPQENEQTSQDIPEDNKIYVTVRRSSGQILNLELEEYVVGVVGAEMPASFHEQALMAQAVIARTYALKSQARGQTLTDNASTQSYKNSEELRGMWGSSYDTYYNKIKNAVMQTRGEYLTYNGNYIEAVYHSTSNGKTENSVNVWGNYFPYLVSVDSPYDSSNPSFQKEQFLSYQELSSKLNMEINIDTIFNILGKTEGLRASSIDINGKVYSGVDFRNLLGLRSADFEISKSESGITFTTKGYGHGVGMSQYGANGMAKNGYSYSQILKHYYRGTAINHL